MLGGRLTILSFFPSPLSVGLGTCSTAVVIACALIVGLGGCSEAPAPNPTQAIEDAEQFIQHGKQAEAAHLLLQVVRDDQIGRAHV